MKQKMISIMVRDIIDMYKNNHLFMYFYSYNNLKIEKDNFWDLRMKSLFVTSLLNNMIINNLYVAEQKNIGFSNYYILDGIERLTAIFDYIEGKFVLPSTTSQIDNISIKNMSFNQLPKKFQNAILDYKIPFVVQSYNIKDNLDTYTRCNGGESLKPIDIFKSKLGNNFGVLENICNHDLFKILSIQGKNYRQYEVGLYFLMLESNPSTGLTKKEKEKFIDNISKELFVSSNILHDIRIKMNYLFNAFNNYLYLNLKKEKYLKKSHIIILYLLTDKAIKYKISERDFFSWCNDFFYLNKDKSNEYWIESSRGSLTSRSSIDIRYKELDKNFSNSLSVENKILTI